FREALAVTTRSSPPGSYKYQIGTVSGPRPSSGILMIPTWRSDRKVSRSSFVIASDIVLSRPSSQLPCCRPTFDMSGGSVEGLGVCVRVEGRRAQRSELRIGDNFVRQVVNHNGAVEVRERRLCTVLLPYERSPALRVQSIGFNSGAPEIDSADRTPVLRQDVVLTDKARYALVFRCCAQEDLSCLVPRDGHPQLVRGDDRDHRFLLRANGG